jgi:DNA-directed RNA polymerase specialized sigma24 family protein
LPDEAADARASPAPPARKPPREASPEELGLLTALQTLVPTLSSVRSSDSEDLVEEAFLDLVSGPVASGPPPTESELRDMLLRIDARLRKRKQRERKAARRRSAELPDDRGIRTPPLCPNLAALADRPDAPGTYLSDLYAAAMRLAHLPRVLRYTQVRAVLLAYEDGLPPARIAELLRVDEHAVVERLRRASQTIERQLVQEIESELGQDTRRRLAPLLRARTVRDREDSAARVSALSRSDYEALFSALGQVFLDQP